MGTLMNQEPREKVLTEESVLYKGREIQSIAKELKITFSEALELYKLQAQIYDYDVKDEQLAGFAVLFEELNSNLNRISDKYE